MTKTIVRGLMVIGAIAGAAACGGDDTNASASVNAPSELMVSELDGGAHVTWKDNSDNESGFMIERMTGSGAWMTIGNVPFDTTQYHDPNLAPGTYSYRVMAMPKSGGHETSEGAYSGEVMLVVSGSDSTGGGAAGSAAVDAGHEQHHP